MAYEKRPFNGLGEKFLDELDGWARGMGDFQVSGQDAKDLVRLARVGLAAERAQSHPPRAMTNEGWVVPLDMIPTPREKALARWSEEHGIPAVKRIATGPYKIDEYEMRDLAVEALAALPKEGK